MFNKYQIGKSYELYYVDTIEINERKYLCVTDGENDYTVAPYDFQLDWPDQISDTLLCYVKSISLSGKPQFVQDRYALLKKRYPLADENLIGRPGRKRYTKQFGILPLTAVKDYIETAKTPRSYAAYQRITVCIQSTRDG